ncbi:hypothetical protein V1264_019716 [Littorina saxatilis]
MDDNVKEHGNSQSSVLPEHTVFRKSNGQGNKDESDDNTSSEDEFFLADDGLTSQQTLPKTVRETDESEDKSVATLEALVSSLGRSSPAGSEWNHGVGMVYNPSEIGSHRSGGSSMQGSNASHHDSNRLRETNTTATGTNSVRPGHPESRDTRVQRETATQRFLAQPYPEASGGAALYSGMPYGISLVGSERNQHIEMICNPSDTDSQSPSVLTVQESGVSHDNIPGEINEFEHTYTTTSSVRSGTTEFGGTSIQREEMTRRFHGQGVPGQSQIFSSSQEPPNAFRPIVHYPGADHFGSLPSDRAVPSPGENSYTRHYSTVSETIEPSFLSPDTTIDDELQEERFEGNPLEVLVKGVSKKTTKETLDLYFQNKFRSEGGAIQESRLDKTIGRYRVRFQSPRVARCVVSKTQHELEGKNLVVTLDHSPTACGGSRGRDTPPRTVAVQGLKTTEMTKDLLLHYFENAPRSGGGEVTDVRLDPTGDTPAFVSFKHHEHARNVSSFRHTLAHKPVTVYLCEDLHQSVFCLYGLGGYPRIGEYLREDLIHFIEGQTHCAVYNVCFGSRSEVEGTALVIFEDDIDMNEVQMALASTQFHHCKLTVGPVQVSRTAEIRNLFHIPSFCKETLATYFSNTRQSGGHRGAEVFVYPQRECALVTFVDPEVCSDVVNRSHVLHGATLDVRTYFDCVGVSSTCDTTPPHHTPDPASPDIRHVTVRVSFESTRLI